MFKNLLNREGASLAKSKKLLLVAVLSSIAINCDAMGRVSTILHQKNNTVSHQDYKRFKDLELLNAECSGYASDEPVALIESLSATLLRYVDPNIAKVVGPAHAELFVSSVPDTVEDIAKDYAASMEIIKNSAVVVYHYEWEELKKFGASELEALEKDKISGRIKDIDIIYCANCFSRARHVNQDGVFSIPYGVTCFKHHIVENTWSTFQYPITRIIFPESVKVVSPGDGENYLNYLSEIIFENINTTFGEKDSMYRFCRHCPKLKAVYHTSKDEKAIEGFKQRLKAAGLPDEIEIKYISEIDR